MAARSEETVLGKERVVLIKKPGGSTFILIGCLTNYDENEPGKPPLKVSCRAGQKRVASGDKELMTLNISGISHEYASGDVASNVSESEIKGWAQAGTTVEAKWGGTLVDDHVSTSKGFFTDFKGSNPQEGFSTYSVTFNCSEEYTTDTIDA